MQALPRAYYEHGGTDTMKDCRDVRRHTPALIGAEHGVGADKVIYEHWISCARAKALKHMKQIVAFVKTTISTWYPFPLYTSAFSYPILQPHLASSQLLNLHVNLQLSNLFHALVLRHIQAVLPRHLPAQEPPTHEMPLALVPLHTRLRRR